MSPDRTFEDHWQRRDLAPYVTACGRVGSGTFSLTEVAKPAGDYPGPSLDSLVLVHDLGRARSVVDLGAGRFRPMPGGMTLVPPAVRTVVTVENRHRVRFLAMPATALRVWSDEAGLDGSVHLGRLHSASFRNPLVEHLVGRLWEASVRPDASALLADAALLTVWGELLAEARRSQPAPVSGGLAPWRLRRCVEYLREHVADDVRLEQLAALAGLSPFHFTRAFKQSTGMPPHRYQLSLRIARAKELLTGTDDPVTDVAFSVGYGSSQAFARMFRSEVGVGPNAYRRALDRPRRGR